MENAQVAGPQVRGQGEHLVVLELPALPVEHEQPPAVALLGRVLGDPVGGQLVVVLLEYERGRLAHGEGVSTNTWKSSGSATMES